MPGHMSSQGRRVDQVPAICGTDCAPCRARHKGAARGIDDDSLPGLIDQQVDWQLVDGLQRPILWIGIYTAFIGRVKVVYNVEERRVAESIAEEAAMFPLCIGWHKASEPIICDYDGRDDSQAAEGLKRCPTKQRHALHGVGLGTVGVGRWEVDLVLQEKKTHTLDHTLVHFHLDTFMIEGHVNVHLPVNIVLCEISLTALTVAIIVWGDHNRLLIELCKHLRELINHNPKASYSRPLAQLRRDKHYGTKRFRCLANTTVVASDLAVASIGDGIGVGVYEESTGGPFGKLCHRLGESHHMTSLLHHLRHGLLLWDHILWNF
mmetsp:Transcript_1229/g.1879  ORF Transcript_1229/g.1879 Transcript_1229/m.1879 type:complete len:321 (-) Transcript_1229:877-1839(-)